DRLGLTTPSTAVVPFVEVEETQGDSVARSRGVARPEGTQEGCGDDRRYGGRAVRGPRVRLPARRHPRAPATAVEQGGRPLREGGLPRPPVEVRSRDRQGGRAGQLPAGLPGARGRRWQYLSVARPGRGTAVTGHAGVTGRTAAARPRTVILVGG